MTFTVSVPNVPGVPAVNRSGLGSAVGSLLTADALSLINNLFNFPQWGIFLGFLPVVVADTVVVFDLRKDWQISSYPVEGGGFTSYNKVYIPFQGTVRFTTGGSRMRRQLLLTTVDAIAGDLNLYSLVTPEAVYPTVNVVSYDYRRTGQDGLGMLSVDVKVEEVRPTAGTSYASTSNAANPSFLPTSSTGPVQTSPATAAQVSMLPTIKSGYPS